MSRLAAGPNLHWCPRRGCDTAVHNRLFCCPVDWCALTGATRLWIGRTNGQTLLSKERRAAIERAREEWGDL